MSMEKSSHQKTAFYLPKGLYQLKVMPFGLVNAPETFVRMVYKLLKGVDNVQFYCQSAYSQQKL